MRDDAHPELPGESAAADRVRLLVEGRISGADADRVRAEIAADPELREFAEAFAAVHASTGGEAFPAAPAEFRGSGAARRAAPGRIRRFPRWAAAAAVLAAAAGAWAWTSERSPFRGPAEVAAPVLASALAVDAPGPAAVPDADAVASALSSLRTERDGKLQWVTDWAQAEALAAASGKPMLVFVQHPTCPWCLELKEGPWSDAAVVAAASDYLPVMLSALDGVPERFHDVYPDKWPFVGVIDDDGRTLAEFPGVRPTESMRERIAAAGVVVRERRASRATWDDVRATAADLAAGRESAAAGRLGDAWVRYGRAAAAESVPMHAAAAAGISSLQGKLRDALSSASEVARADAVSAAKDLRTEAARFAGSPPGTELLAVADALERRGRFPQIVKGPQR